MSFRLHEPNRIEQTDDLNVAQPANENMLIPCVLFTSVCVCSKEILGA